MTIRQIFRRVEEQFPHGYKDGLLLAWINDLERDIAEVFTHYKGTEQYTFENHTSLDEDVQIEEPQIYVPYLIAQICLANQEYDHYNNHSQIFMAKYQDWRDQYIREHMPVSQGTYKL